MNKILFNFLIVGVSLVSIQAASAMEFDRDCPENSRSLFECLQDEASRKSQNQPREEYIPSPLTNHNVKRSLNNIFEKVNHVNDPFNLGLIPTQIHRYQTRSVTKSIR